MVGIALADRYICVSSVEVVTTQHTSLMCYGGLHICYHLHYNDSRKYQPMKIEQKHLNKLCSINYYLCDVINKNGQTFCNLRTVCFA